jgi:ribonuclease HI
MNNTHGPRKRSTEFASALAPIGPAADWVISFDGAITVNPGGLLGFGYRLVGPGVERTGRGGRDPAPGNTCNAAEWIGLTNALEHLQRIRAAGRPVESLLIQGDSELVIFQLGGRYKCHKPHLAEHRDRCHQLLRDIGLSPYDGTASAPWWRATWVPRHRNAVADGLSREGQASVVTGRRS